MEEFRQLSDFALAVYPAIKNSSAWVKLTCKRWMGAGPGALVRPGSGGDACWCSANNNEISKCMRACC